MDSKLRCVFAMPAGQEQNNTEEPKFEARNQAATTPVAPVKVIWLNYKNRIYMNCGNLLLQPAYSQKVSYKCGLK